MPAARCKCWSSADSTCPATPPATPLLRRRPPASVSLAAPFSLRARERGGALPAVDLPSRPWARSLRCSRSALHHNTGEEDDHKKRKTKATAAAARASSAGGGDPMLDDADGRSIDESGLN